MDEAIYRFGKNDTDGTVGNKALLGGKGANLAEMARIGLPVPPGFTLTTKMCNRYRELQGASRNAYLTDLTTKAIHEMYPLIDYFGYMPLVSIRSGAPVSMPGMMDTILNVGITQDTVQEWINRIGARTTFDCYRRLIQMYGEVVLCIPKELFEIRMEASKAEEYFQSAGEAKTVACLMAGGYKNVSQKFIDEVIGGDEAFHDLQEMIADYGNEQCKPVPRPVTMERAMYELLN
jgi:pyruvate,orthophosphate dikinase